MKAKIYFGILQVLMLTGLTANAQTDYSGDYRNDNATVVVNNYYDNYDYYYSSRINRFHRSYSAFDYYAPVFTDTYWYNYQPYSWGVSIYGGGGFGAGFANSYPVYNYGYAYNPGGYDPYYGYSYYGGYDPFYYSNWYSASVVNIRIGYSWPGYYWGYNGHDHHYSHHNYDYRHGHNSYNNYYNNNYYSSRSSSNSSYRRTSPGHSTEVNIPNSSGNSAGRRNPGGGISSNANYGNSGKSGNNENAYNNSNHGNNGNSGNVNNNGNSGNIGNPGSNYKGNSTTVRSSSKSSTAPASFNNRDRSGSRRSVGNTGSSSRSTSSGRSGSSASGGSSSSKSSGSASSSSKASSRSSSRSSSSPDNPTRRR